MEGGWDQILLPTPSPGRAPPGLLFPGASWEEGPSVGQCYLTDVVPEDGLVLRAPELPLEPGLRFPVVRDLQGRSSIPDLRKVRHRVPHGDGSERT